MSEDVAPTAAASKLEAQATAGEENTIGMDQMDGHMDLRASALAGGEMLDTEPDFSHTLWSGLLERISAEDH